VKDTGQAKLASLGWKFLNHLKGPFDQINRA
jgi:hypothetical protein